MKMPSSPAPAFGLCTLLLAAACRTAAPTTPEACAAVSDAAARDECFLTVLPAVFRTDPTRAVELTEKSVADAATRDFIYLTVTRDVDPNSEKYCDRIADTNLKARCRVLVSRPHLHRDLMNGKPPPMAPMGARGGPPRAPAPAAPTPAPTPAQGTP